MTATRSRPASPPGLLDGWLDELIDDGRIVHVERLAARPARYGRLRAALPDAVSSRVGFELYSHQAEAIDLIRSGRSAVVATGTASGKSLCYQLPIAEAITDRIRPGTALIITPTKALAQDQLRALGQFDFPGLVAATFDGDASPEQRSWARAKANVVFTNPEMVHASILPNHRKWSTFLSHLRYVVIDELHALRGVFGSHVAHVLRRLRRLCETYGSRPTFVFSSATIGQPAELAEALCGQPVVAVTADGSPRGPRTFAVLNPPLVDPDAGLRISANSETACAAAQLISLGLRTIVFCRSRKTAEYVAADIRGRVPPALRDTIRAYRAGYLADERREIEDEIARGEVRGIVATTALELGVDLAGVDACVLNGFPGTIASMWQQAGRAGRGRAPSVTVLVAGDDQLDQWLAAHPKELFQRPPEPAVINPDNAFIVDPHVACAAYEKPVSYDDGRYWADSLDESIRSLVAADQLRLRFGLRRRRHEPAAVWAGKGVPAPKVGLRNGTSSEFKIVSDDGFPIGTVDGARAFTLVHPGAIYLHQGRGYRVVELDLDQRRAVVENYEGDDYTQARRDIELTIVRAERQRRVGAAMLHLGTVEVTTQVSGYQRRRARQQRVIESKPLDLPPTVLRTRAVWYTIGDPQVDGDALGGALHAVEHAAIGLLPLFTICDRWDVGGVSTEHHSDTGLPSIFIYDGYPGGAGIAELGYGASDRHLLATREVIAECPCAAGCPSCVQSPKCGNGNEPLDKRAAAQLLRDLLL